MKAPDANGPGMDLPLPQGEGRGEGEQSIKKPRSPAAPHTATNPLSHVQNSAAIRAKLGNQRPPYWRSLEELAETKEFQNLLSREFPAGAAEWVDGVSRRTFLKLAAGSLALSGLT